MFSFSPLLRCFVVTCSVLLSGLIYYKKPVKFTSLEFLNEVKELMLYSIVCITEN